MWYTDQNCKLLKIKDNVNMGKMEKQNFNTGVSDSK